MFVSNRIDIDKKDEKKVGPHKTCQMVMVRGLLQNWKQPIYYKFDQPMTCPILNEIIVNLYNVGFFVVAMTSDMGPSNRKLLSELGIGYDKTCFFGHPSDNSWNIYVFADAPHLIKLVRNHILDAGLIVDNNIINKLAFEPLLETSISELTLAHKINRFHLDVKGSQRQKVTTSCTITIKLCCKSHCVFRKQSTFTVELSLGKYFKRSANV